MTRTMKISVFVVILLSVLIFLVSSFFKLTNTDTFSVDELLLENNKGVVSEKQIVVTGKIDISSIEIINATKSELKFDLISETTNNKIHVLYRGDSKPGLTNDKVVYIKGHYTVERLFIGEKIIKN